MPWPPRRLWNAAVDFLCYLLCYSFRDEKQSTVLHLRVRWKINPGCLQCLLAPQVAAATVPQEDQALLPWLGRVVGVVLTVLAPASRSPVAGRAEWTAAFTEETKAILLCSESWS